MEGVWRHGKAIVYAVSIASLAGNMMALMMTHSPARLPAIAIAMPRSMLPHIAVPGSLLHPYSDLLLYFLLNGIVLAILLKSGVWARYHGDGAGAGRGEANTIIFRKGGEDSGEEAEEEEEEEEEEAGDEAMVGFLTRGLLDYANPGQEGEGSKDLMLSSSRSQDEVLLLGLDPAMAGSTTKLDIKVQEDQKEEEEKQEEYGILQLNTATATTTTTTTTTTGSSSSIDPPPPAAAAASIFSIEPIEWDPDATDAAIASDPDSDSADAALAAAAAIASVNTKHHLHTKLHNRHHGNSRPSHHKPKAKKRNNHAHQHHHHHGHNRSSSSDEGSHRGDGRKPGDGDDYDLDRRQFNERVESFITRFKRNLTMQREASLTRLLSLLQPSSNGNKRSESPG